MATDQQVLEEYQRTGSKRKAASNLGMPWTTFRGALKRALIRVEGITPSHTTLDPAELLAKLINRQDRKDASIELSRNQRITVKDDKPIVIALLSDTHWGNNKTDYRALKRDTDLIAGCPYCYGITAGDYSENWIGKLGWIAREQSITKDDEAALVRWWFDQLSDSLLAVCSGNHDNRTIVAAGYDYIRGILGDGLMLYDADQILFTLDHAGVQVRFKVRHRDQYKSILNPYHGAFRDIERGDYDWDVYVSGHDHRATVFGSCIHHDKPRMVVRLGTYKLDDRYGKAIGFARSYGTGSGALVIDKGKVQGFASIEAAIRFCGILRQ